MPSFFGVLLKMIGRYPITTPSLQPKLPQSAPKSGAMTRRKREPSELVFGRCLRRCARLQSELAELGRNDFCRITTGPQKLMAYPPSVTHSADGGMHRVRRLWRVPQKRREQA